MPSAWNHEADKDLLLTIIDGDTLKSIDWKSIADKMKAKGYTFTHEGCRQHFQKIRKDSKTSNGATNSGSTSPSTIKNPKPKTPRKLKAKSASTSTSSFATTVEDGDDDDEEFGEANPTPAKRKRVAEPKKEEDDEQSAPLFKGEDDGHVDLERDDLYYSDGLEA